MRIIGLTGSIGMGKSTVAGLFEHLGIPCHDADAAVHDLMLPDGEGHSAVMDAFPSHQYPQMYKKKCPKTKKYFIDRKELGKIIFNNSVLKQELEGILHPLVRSAQNNFIAKMRRFRQDFVLLDIPLLFETDSYQYVDYTVTVSAPYHIQRQRVLERSNMNEDKFEAVLNAQMPDAQKRVMSDYVVETGLGRARTLQNVKFILADIKNEKRKASKINNEFKHQKSRSI